MFGYKYIALSELSLFDKELVYISHAVLRYIKHADPDLGTFSENFPKRKQGIVAVELASALFIQIKKFPNELIFKFQDKIFFAV